MERRRPHLRNFVYTTLKLLLDNQERHPWQLTLSNEDFSPTMCHPEPEHTWLLEIASALRAQVRTGSAAAPREPNPLLSSPEAQVPEEAGGFSYG